MFDAIKELFHTVATRLGAPRTLLPTSVVQEEPENTPAAPAEAPEKPRTSYIRRVFSAAHAWVGISSGAITGSLVGVIISGALVGFGVIAGAEIADVGVTILILLVIALCIASVVDEKRSLPNKVFFYALAAEMFIICGLPLVEPVVPFWVSTLPFGALASIYLFQGIRYANNPDALAPPEPARQEELDEVSARLQELEESQRRTEALARRLLERVRELSGQKLDLASEQLVWEELQHFAEETGYDEAPAERLLRRLERSDLLLPEA